MKDATEMRERSTNWAGNYAYEAKRLHTPGSVEEIMELVRNSAEVKALGARHSFNGIADSRGDHISLERFDNISFDAQARSVTVGAGVTYGRLCPLLHERVLALPNLASLPHLSVVGACVTATHGSGVHNGNLSTVVTAIEFVTGEGKLETLSRESDGGIFPGAVVNLGGLGIITAITLRVEPASPMTQLVYENLPFSYLDAHLDEIFSSGYSVSLFTDWRESRATQVWIKQRLDEHSSAAPAPEFFGATPAQASHNPLPGHSAEHCTEQMGIAGAWHERLPHFRMDFTPSSGAELQSEYFVPREQGALAIRAIERLGEQISPHLYISEIRTIAEDDLWMSPCYRRPSLAIHFTWKPEWAAVQPLLAKIEEALQPFAARPHWAKLFTTSPSVLQGQYERLPEFRELLRRYDPAGKFRNSFLRTNLY